MDEREVKHDSQCLEELCAGSTDLAGLRVTRVQNEALKHGFEIGCQRRPHFMVVV